MRGHGANRLASPTNAIVSICLVWGLSACVRRHIEDASQVPPAATAPTQSGSDTPIDPPPPTPPPAPARPDVYDTRGLAPLAFDVTCAEGVIKNYYRVMMKRDVDPSGLDYWKANFSRLGAKGVARALFFSPEHLQRIIGAIYLKFLRRAADSTALAHYVGKLQAEAVSEGDVVREIGASDEYFAVAARQKPSSDPNRSFIELLFSDLFGRPPEQSHIDYWVPKLNNKTLTRSQVVKTFQYEAEYLTRYLIALTGDYLWKTVTWEATTGLAANLKNRSFLVPSALVDERLKFLASDEFLAMTNKKGDICRQDDMLIATGEGKLYSGTTGNGKLSLEIRHDNFYIGAAYSNSHSTAAHSGDFNADGRLDVALLLDSGNIWLQTSTPGPYVSIDALQDANQRAFFAPYFSRFTRRGRVFPMDMNGDDRTDLVLLTERGEIYAFVFQANTFGVQLMFADANLGAWFPPDSPIRILTGDFDGNLMQDFALLTTGGTIKLLLSNGLNLYPVDAGTFSNWGGIFAKGSGARIVAGRFANSDVRDDIAVMWKDGTIWTFVSEGIRFTGPLNAFGDPAKKDAFDSKGGARARVGRFRKGTETQILIADTLGDLWLTNRVGSAGIAMELVEHLPSNGDAYRSTSANRLLPLFSDGILGLRLLQTDGTALDIQPAVSIDTWKPVFSTSAWGGVFNHYYAGARVFPYSESIEPLKSLGIGGEMASYTELAIYWSDPNVQAAQGVSVYRTQDGNWQLIRNLPPTQTYLLDAVPPGRYSYKVVFTGDNGNGVTDPVVTQVTMEPPPAPPPSDPPQ